MRVKRLFITGSLVCAMLLCTSCGKSGGSLSDGNNFSIESAVNEINPTTTEAVTEATTEEVTETTSEDTEITTEESIPVNTSPVVVTDLVNESGTVEFEYGSYEYYFRLPKIEGVSSDYIDTIKADIETIKAAYVDGQYEDIAGGYSLAYPKVGYVFSSGGGLNSLMIYMYSDWESKDYVTYNFDDEGNRVSNEKILSDRGIYPEDFLGEVRVVLGQYVNFEGNEYIDANDPFVIEVKEKTLSDENINMDIPMFVNENGIIGYIGRFYSMAGADFYDNEYQLGSLEPIIR